MYGSTFLIQTDVKPPFNIEEWKLSLDYEKLSVNVNIVFVNSSDSYKIQPLILHMGHSKILGAKQEGNTCSLTCHRLVQMCANSNLKF